MKIEDITESFKDYQETADMLNLDMEIVLMYQSFYEHHKQIHGSYKDLIMQPEYEQKMNERNDYIFCRINTTIESKLEYEKNIKGN